MGNVFFSANNNVCGPDIEVQDGTIFCDKRSKPSGGGGGAGSNQANGGGRSTSGYC